MGPAPFYAMHISVMMLGNSMRSRAPYCPNFSRSTGIEYIWMDFLNGTCYLTRQLCCLFALHVHTRSTCHRGHGEWPCIHVIRPDIVGTYRYWAPKYESRPTDGNSRYIWIPIFRFCQKLKLVFRSPQMLALCKFTTGSGNRTSLVFRNR